MYKVKLDDKYIYHPWDKDLQINDPKLDTELNKNGSFSFAIYPDNPMYNSLEKLKSKLHIIRFDQNGNEKEIFRCRVLSEETDFDGEKTVTCEGDLAFLFRYDPAALLFDGFTSRPVSAADQILTTRR